jgi:hypothetical protein
VVTVWIPVPWLSTWHVVLFGITCAAGALAGVYLGAAIVRRRAVSAGGVALALFLFLAGILASYPLILFGGFALCWIPPLTGYGLAWCAAHRSVKRISAP